MTYDSIRKSARMHQIEFTRVKYFEKRHYSTLLPPTLGAPNELFCKIAVLLWVFCWENLSSFMSCWKDEMRLLGDFLKNLFVKWALWPRSGEIFFKTLHNLRKFAEIMDVHDETHIIHSCYAAGWEKY